MSFQISHSCSVQFRKLVSHVTTAGSADFTFSSAQVFSGDDMFEDMYEVCAALHVKSMCFFDGYFKRVQFINPMGIESLRRAAAAPLSTNVPADSAATRVL